ncbi:hypothetical protein ACQP2P_14700 [Dactylosporangium sp. CA-139114]|uniref:hypothetical protein n=1 Tax=Dactylosporangium sp. CA-139114 TaxID=3239931 RepID=UPI003D96A0E6
MYDNDATRRSPATAALGVLNDLATTLPVLSVVLTGMPRKATAAASAAATVEAAACATCELAMLPTTTTTTAVATRLQPGLVIAGPA